MSSAPEAPQPLPRLAPAAPDAPAAAPAFPDAMSGLQDLFKNLQAFDPFARTSREPGARADAAAEPGRFVEAEFTNASGARPYRLYVPSRYEAGTPVPLVVMLHGCTQSPDDFAAGTRMNALAERDGFLVCYPAQTASANGQRCWNWFSADDQRRGRGEPSLIAGITREIMTRYAVDPHRVYVAGLSAGGALAATMGQTYPDLYAAVGVHSGLACGAAHDVSSAFSAMRKGGGAPRREADAAGVPTIVFHGDRDQTVNPVNADEVATQTLNGADVRIWVEDGQVEGGHGWRRTRHLGPDGRAIVEVWAVHGAGHAWSGGSAAGSYTDPQGPDASGEMLRFFAEQTGPVGTV